MVVSILNLARKSLLFDYSHLSGFGAGELFSSGPPRCLHWERVQSVPKPRLSCLTHRANPTTLSLPDLRASMLTGRWLYGLFLNVVGVLIVVAGVAGTDSGWTRSQP